MALRVLLFAGLVAASYFIPDARAQTSTPPGAAPAATTPSPAPSSSATKQEARKQVRAAKKAERITIRKKRAECYDQAKKQSVTGQALPAFLETCRKK